MRIEHINLVVNRIEDTKNFLLCAFPDWRVRGSGKGKWYNKERHWVHIGNDDYYITLNDNGVGENRDLKGHTPGLAHIGFVVDDMQVICHRLTSAGYKIRVTDLDHPVRKTVYFVDPQGFEFEFMQYLSQKPEEKNHYSE